MMSLLQTEFHVVICKTCDKMFTTVFKEKGNKYCAECQNKFDRTYPESDEVKEID